MQFRLIRPEHQELWRSGFDGVPHHSFHLPDCLRILHRGRCREMLLVHGRDGDAVCSLPLLVREHAGTSDVATPYGYGGLTGVGLKPRHIDALKEFLTNAGYVCAYIALALVADLAQALRAETVHQGAPAIVLDVTPDECELRSEMTRIRRQHTRSQPGVVIKRSKNDRTVDEFCRQYAATMERAGAPEFYRFAPDSLRDIVLLPSAHLYSLEEDGAPQCSAVILRTPYVADCLFAASTARGRRHSSALMWAAMMHQKELGVSLVNFGGGVRAGDSLQRYKQSFGGQLRPFQRLQWVLNEPKYVELCHRVGVPGGQEEQFFPPYHASWRHQPNPVEERALEPVHAG